MNGVCYNHSMNTLINVRELKQEEIEAARELIFETFSRFVAPDCTAEGIECFRKFLYGDRILLTATFYGVFEADALQGALVYQKDRGHICAFFVRDGLQGKGYGGTLMRWFLQNIAEGDVTVNASAYGVPVYERFAFTATDAKQCKNGMSFTPMKRKNTSP